MSLNFYFCEKTQTCFETRCKISKDRINIIPTYGMKVKIINRYGVFLTINKNEKRKSLL